MWDCPKCGARIDEGFDSCWSCHAHRLSAPAVAAEVPVADPPAASEVAPEPDGSWNCPKCGTGIEPNFEVCWSCGTSIDGVEDPTFAREDEEAVIPEETEPLIPVEDPTFAREHEKTAPGAPQCPICSVAMREGFLADHTQGAVQPTIWVAGPPQPSFWTGTWVADERYQIQVFRCPECGYLESYARKPG